MDLMGERVDEAFLLVPWVVPFTNISRTDNNTYGHSFVWLATKDHSAKYLVWWHRKRNVPWLFHNALYVTRPLSHLFEHIVAKCRRSLCDIGFPLLGKSSYYGPPITSSHPFAFVVAVSRWSRSGA